MFLGVNQKTKKHVAIKVLLPISPEKIKREYHIMRQLDHPNIVKLLDIVKAPHLRTSSFVFEHVDCVDFRELYPKLKYDEIRNYMRQLLSVTLFPKAGFGLFALEGDHAQGY